MIRKIPLGLGAGLLSALLGLGVAYIVGVVSIAAEVKEFFPTLLAAATVLPLMLLFILLAPTVVIGLLVGLTIGLIGNGASRVYLIGALAGLTFGLVILRGVLPLIFGHAPDDFVSIIDRPLVSGVYSLFLGLTTARFFNWFSRT